MENSGNGNYTRGFILGAVIGGVVGALTALLTAPKTGKELRTDIAHTSTDLYEKASDYVGKVSHEVGDIVAHTYKDSKDKAAVIVEAARSKAETLLHEAESVLKDAKSKAVYTRDNVEKKIDAVKDAAKASADTFRTEMKSSENNPHM